MVEVDPFEADEVLIRRVAASIPDLPRPHSTLEVRRRWVADDLEGRDVLEACAAIVGHHHAFVAALSDQCRSGTSRLPHEYLARVDMRGPLGTMADPTFRMYRADGRSFDPEKIDPSDIEIDEDVVRERVASVSAALGVAPPVFDFSPTTSMSEVVERQLEAARFFLEADGQLLAVAWWRLASGGGWRRSLLNFADKAAKYHFFHSLGNDAARGKIDAAVFCSEIWIGLGASIEPYADLSQHPNRMEAVSVSGVTSDGSSTSRLQPFIRDENGRPVVSVKVMVDRDIAGIGAGIWRPLLVGWGVDTSDADELEERMTRAPE